MNSFSGWFTDLRIGWRNLGRNTKRTLLACLAIAIAQAGLIWIDSFMRGYEVTLFNAMTGPLLGHLQVHAPKYQDDEAIERVIPNASAVEKEILSQPHVKSLSARIYAPVLASLKEMGYVARVTGMDIPQESGEGGMLEGLKPEQYPVGQEVLVGKGLAENMGVKEGDTLALMGQAVDGSIASGLYRVKAVIQSPLDQINQAGIVMSLPLSRDFLNMGDAVHEIVIHADSPTAIPGLLSTLKGLPSLKNMEILSWNQIMPSIADLFQMVDKMNYVFLALVFLATIAGVANTMLMATFERTREFGMLLALGCRPGRMIRVVVIESLTLGILGAVVGSLVGMALVWPGITRGIDLGGLSAGKVGGMSFEGVLLNMRLFFILKPPDVLNGFGAVCVTSLLASLWPAHRILKLEPMEAMRT
jgi:putative ABC transport system permease protein